MLSVTKPTRFLRDAFLRMLDDYEADDPKTGTHYRQGREDFAAYVQGLHDDENGLVGYVPPPTESLATGWLRYAPGWTMRPNWGWTGYYCMPTWTTPRRGARLNGVVECLRQNDIQFMISV